MASDQTPEQRELSLIGKVEMRIALADSDSRLEATLKTYLAPLLLKLASDHVTVRNKVIAVCQHISTRTKPQSIQLPVAALVKQFKEQESSLIRHFDLVYIQQGVSRLSPAAKAELLPTVVANISQSAKHGPKIFHLFLRLLSAFKLPMRGSQDDVELRTKLGISEADAAYLASWSGRFLLFTPQKPPSTSCPGLTSDDYYFLSVEGKEGAWDVAAGGISLLQTKTLVAKFLSSGLFADKERFLPALYASADPASSIADAGDDMMKRAMPATDLEDEHLVKRLFDLYFGEGGAPRVRAPLRLKILALLNKSTKSTTFSHQIMRLVDDGISAAKTDGEDVVMSNTTTTGSNAGREATKLRAAIFTYTNFCARYGSPETLHAIATPVVARLRDYIEDQGWPKPGFSEDLVSRAYAYEVIGLLAKVGPRDLLVETEHPTLDLLRWLFSSLARDSAGNSITVSIEEALSTVLTGLARLGLDDNEQSVLEELLIQEMVQSADLEINKRLRSTRYVAVRFANRCLPYNSVKARWVNVLGLGAAKERGEVREESERGLSPYWYRMLNGSLGESHEIPVVPPTFGAVMQQFFAGRTMVDDTLAVAKDAQSRHKDEFSHMISFARRILFQQALTAASVPLVVDSEWERRLDTAVETDPKAHNAVKEYIHNLATPDSGNVRTKTSPALSTSDADHVRTLLFALFLGLAEGVDSGAQLVEFLSLSTNSLIHPLAQHLSSLAPVLKSNNHSKRMAAARAFGILASLSDPNTDIVKIIIQELLESSRSWSSAIGTHVNQSHGAVTALGFYFSRVQHRGTDISNDAKFQAFVEIAAEMVTTARDKLLQEGASIALGQLAIFNALSVELLEKSTKLRTLTNKFYEYAKGGNETAILALGQFSMILLESAEEDDELTYVAEQLHKLHEIRQAEVHFTVGEAWSCVVSGWRSTAMATKFDVDAPRPAGPDRKMSLNKWLPKILADCANTKPALKKAAVMWLLCLVQFCGEEPDVQERLPQCQAAFRRCLGDRDELVQETASRGLGLVYEKGDRKLKDDLVRDLVSSFSSDKQSQLAGNVSAETQLFEPGALPTGDGSVSTYKDIMSLAAEVGDSTLVYKFMSMASSNAIWSSRAAFGRFGLSNVLSDSSVDGYLAENPKLYPKLYRYRFDPSSGVQKSMNEIWNALVKDSAKTIDKYFDAIMEDLLVAILGKEWRTRQASCAAIADLVQGRPLEKYEGYLERIWQQCFRVLDDIKESVRAAAALLARVMTGVLTRALEADHSSSKNAATMLKHVLPFLLSASGMESSAEEVRLFSVHTLLEIIKKSNGQTLRPFIPELVERLLASLSSLEPEAVNYLHLNASKYNLTEQKIDDMRLSSVRSSPLMEAIERCLDLLDDETMQKLQPKLERAMKSAVGLPSKVGSSRVLVSLATRRPVIFRAYADAFLKLIEKVLMDRNETVSSSYAIAAGYVARTASDQQILRLFTFTQKLYFETEGDREGAVPRRALASGEIMHAVSKHASDRFSALAASALPFVFVAKHDPHEQVKEQFQKTWDESVGGSRAVSLYLREILALCMQHLDSAQWALKHTSARAVADCVTTVASLETNMSAETAAAIWPALEKALGGKSYSGKEVVLFALARFAESAKAFYTQTPTTGASITKIAIREAKRQNVAYRQHAIKALGQISAARSDVDMSDAVFEVVGPLLQASIEGNDDDDDKQRMDIDGQEDSKQKVEDIRQSTIANAVEAIFASTNAESERPGQVAERLSRGLEMVEPVQQLSTGVVRSTLTSLAAVMTRLAQAREHGKTTAEFGSEAVVAGLRKILFGQEPGTEALRLLRADAILATTKGLGAESRDRLRAEVAALIEREQSSVVVRDRLGAALDLMQ